MNREREKGYPECYSWSYTFKKDDIFHNDRKSEKYYCKPKRHSISLLPDVSPRIRIN